MKKKRAESSFLFLLVTEAAKAGKDIIHISFSSALSGGYQNVVNGANEVMEEYPDCKIIVQVQEHWVLPF